MHTGTLSIVGLGPGSLELLAPQARNAIERADFVVGYKVYLEMITSLLTEKETLSSGMTREVERASAAVDAAMAGKRVALVSSGDAGIYAMGSLALELLQDKGWQRETGCQIELIPGITAANACAALVGTPLAHDSCTISLSDLLTPWDVIEKRIEAAAAADFAITFYNPRSRKRQQHILTAQQILLKHRAPSTPVAIVENGHRDEQRIVISDLASFTDEAFGMMAAVIVGNSNSYLFEGMIVTPRGYRHKYELTDGKVKPGQKRGRALNTASSAETSTETNTETSE